MPTIRFTNRLVRHVDCPEATVDGSTVIELLRGYFAMHDRVEGYVLDESGQLRTLMTIFVDGKPIIDRSNLEQEINSDAVIDVIQALSGG